MSRVQQLIDSWGADVTCDSPRDAQRMRQMVTLARELEAEIDMWVRQYPIWEDLEKEDAA